MTAVPKEKPVPITRSCESSALVQQAKSGCKESFRQLVISNHQMVRVFISRFIRCGAQIDDLAQEVFLIAFQKLEDFRDDSKFSTWLLGIARNTTIHFIRKEVTAKKNQQRFFEAEVAQRRLKELDLSDSELSLSVLKIDAMKFCLHELPEKSRQLVEQYYVERESSTKIGTRESISSSAVRMKLKRIRKIIKACIERKLDVSPQGREL